MELEDLEGKNDFPKSESLEIANTLSETEKNYISEAIESNNSEFIISRIDEITCAVPPKAIDSNEEISALLKKNKGKIDIKYLEAPNDIEQAEKISDAMSKIEGADYDTWCKLSKEERLEVMQKIENVASKIAHRPSCQVNSKYLGENHLGYFSPDTKKITLNSRYLESDRESYYKSIETIIHEGRHGYQDYNMYSRQVHPSSGDITNWVWNQFECGYQSAEIYGFKRYWMQPVETDARKFAEDVTKRFYQKV